MGMIVNPYILASTAPFHHYALAKGDNTDIVDAGSIHSGGTMTVPANWNGRYARYTAGYWESHGSGGDLTYSGRKGGSNFDGSGIEISAQTSTVHGGPIICAPIPVTSGDTFTTAGLGGLSGHGNWSCLEVMPAGFKGALVNRVSTGFSVGASETTVEWNNEIYDTDGYHDNSTNPSRLTVPSGSSGLTRICGSIVVAAGGGECGIVLYKNGSVLASLVQFDTIKNAINFMSQPLAVSTGDYFEVKVYTTSATTVSVSNNSWLSIEELPSSLKYAIARVTTNQSIPSGVVMTSFIGNTEEVDVGGWFTAGGSNFVVPSGISLVRFGMFGTKTGSSGDFHCSMRVNATEGPGMAKGSSISGPSLDFAHCVSGILAVSAGDTIDWYAATNAGAQSIRTFSFCWIEEVPAVTS